MLKETKTEETIVFFVTFLSLVAFELGEGARAIWASLATPMSGLVFLNFAKAFDTVDHHILLQKLEHYGIRGIVLQLYQSF